MIKNGISWKLISPSIYQYVSICITQFSLMLVKTGVISRAESIREGYMIGVYKHNNRILQIKVSFPRKMETLID